MSRKGCIQQYLIIDCRASIGHRNSGKEKYLTSIKGIAIHPMSSAWLKMNLPSKGDSLLPEGWSLREVIDQTNCINSFMF